VNLGASQPARRRRGVELENALLDATWQEIVDRGYAAMTIESVAERAGTSRPVIYRRWPTKADLVRATLERTMTRDPMELPDTGSLRGDLIAVMRYANERRIGTTALLASYLGAYFQETGTSPAELRESVLGDRSSAIDVVIDRAVARGEVDPARVTRRVRSVAFDLFRHEALMTLKPVPDNVIDEILDEVFLPLVTDRR
jgi:AcrR family transcriptional regulator